MLFVCLHYTVRLFYKRFTISKRMHCQYEIQTIVRLFKLISGVEEKKTSYIVLDLIF